MRIGHLSSGIRYSGATRLGCSLDFIEDNGLQGLLEMQSYTYTTVSRRSGRGRLVGCFGAVLVVNTVEGLVYSGRKNGKLLLRDR